MGRRVFQVPDVSCSHCVSAIEGAVVQIGGVMRVTVDLDRKLVDVEGTFDEADVVAAITDAGYEVTGASGGPMEAG